MSVLILHSRYQSGTVSGENRVVEDEASLLRSRGHTVTVWHATTEATSRRQRAVAGARAVWSKDAQRQLRTTVERFVPDVIHCHNLFPGFSPAVLRRAAGGPPVVVTLHNFRFACLPATFARDGRICEVCAGHLPWRGVTHRCYRRSTLGSASLAASITLHRAIKTFEQPALYLAVSEFVREKYLAMNFCPRERMIVKPNFAWDAAPRVGPGEYFLYLGRLSSEKGVDRLLRVWPSIGARLIVAGAGDPLISRMATNTVGVEFLGEVTPDRVPKLLARAKALVLPSTSYEAGPRSIVEACAAGVPVIASDIGAIPEFVDHGSNGLLVPPTDEQVWRDSLRRLNDKATSARMGSLARAVWKSRFDPESAAIALETAYLRAATIPMRGRV